MGNEQKPKHDPLVDLDDPAELDWSERPPSTKRPSFDAQALAAHIESAEGRVTVPPAPTYDMLRDSCRQMAVAEAADDLLEEPKDDRRPSTSAVLAKNSDAARAARAAVLAADAKKKAK